MLTIDGLVTGIDTTTVIDGLLQIQQRQIDQFDTRRNAVLREKTAFSGVESRLISLRGSLGKLNNIQRSALLGKVATSSDEDVLTAAASDNATPGVYTLHINSLAHAHQVASQGFAGQDAAITKGTLQLRTGSGSVTTITIDDSNDTLEGLADAINNSEASVNASIINDGSTGGTPFRLLLTSRDTGTANAITLTNNLVASDATATQPTFDFDNPIQEASDAEIVFGSGAGALQVFSATNTVQDIIPGVDLDLHTANPDKEISLSVANDTEGAVEVIQGFVESYNDLMQYIDDQSDYNPDSQVAGVLLGNRSVIDFQGQVRQAVFNSVPDVNTNMSRLTSIGISLTNDGRMNFDSSKLTDALNGKVAKVTARDVARLFAMDGSSDNPAVRFVTGSTRTTASKVQVDITSAAERASILATNAITEPVVIDGSNNTFRISLDKQESGDLVLEDGSYTMTELAEHIQEVINGDDDLAGRLVLVSIEEGRLRLTSEVYGSISEVRFIDGSATSILGFDGTESDIGQDVVGTFTVDGVEEKATGRGRLLVGDRENATTGGLQIRVSLTSGQVAEGSDNAQVTLSRGIGTRLDNVLGDLLDAVDGRVKFINDSYDSRVKGIDDALDRMNARIESQRESLVSQFAALESSVADLQSIGSLLGAQLAGLGGLG